MVNHLCTHAGFDHSVIYNYILVLAKWNFLASYIQFQDCILTKEGIISPRYRTLFERQVDDFALVSLPDRDAVTPLSHRVRNIQSP